MKNVLDECRKNFGEAPRKFSWWDENFYLKVKRDADLNEIKELSLFYDTQRDILESGRVVWGHIAQVNSLMYENNKFDCPGVVAYSDDEATSISHLSFIAHQIYDLKHTNPAGEALKTFADIMTSEQSPGLARKVPEVLDRTDSCFVTSVLFVRKHLPGRSLNLNYFPLLVREKKPETAMILPSRFWPPSFVMKWLNANQ